MTVTLTHKESGLIKQCKCGFSWTYLFFGSLVPLFRGDFKWFFISIAIGLFTLGLGHFVLAFIYNRIYIKGLLFDGFIAQDEISKNHLIAKGWIAKSE